MRTREKFHLVGLVIILSLIAYLIANKDSIIREHLTSKPPSLFSLQKDVEETDKKVEALKADFDRMKAQASAQASQAAAARAQISAAKNS
jgi:hypothetical protein